ncbi:MAG: hypothetical protein ABI333_08585 [bacterium]
MRDSLFWKSVALAGVAGVFLLSFSVLTAGGVITRPQLVSTARAGGVAVTEKTWLQGDGAYVSSDSAGKTLCFWRLDKTATGNATTPYQVKVSRTGCSGTDGKLSWFLR